MKKTTTTLLFLYFQLILSQNYKIEYGMFFNQNLGNSKESKQDNNIKLLADKTENVSKLITFILEINDSITSCKSIKPMETDNDPMAKAIYKSFSNYEYYKNIKTNKKYKLADFFNKKYLVQYEKQFEWKVTTENKKIDNYLCYKAIGKDKNEEIIAWFCPDFQVNEGPQIYDGLPGLIFEIQTSKISYFLKSIDTKIANKVINFPKISPISEEEFNNLVSSTLKKIKG
jgi:GLPGLI family protein